MRLARMNGASPRYLAFQLIIALGLAQQIGRGGESVTTPEGVLYTNIVVADVPWSIHLVKASRDNRLLEVRTPHAGGGALGMSPLSEQVADVNPKSGSPIAGINGGFYQRVKAYAGCPRGLQVVDGELFSGPSGNVSLWVDLLGEMHMTNVISHYEIIWPDGIRTPFDLNGPRSAHGVSLYTPALGSSTHTTNGLEFVLEQVPGSRWGPLRSCQNLAARVTEVREDGDTPLSSGTMVLSLGPEVMSRFRNISRGAILRISTESSPRLLGARQALSGGPWLVRDGTRQKIRASPEDTYELSSMLERHPRTAVGWNKDSYFFVVVDGRQREISDGMTLDELSGFLADLGCREAFNLDGGGSSTLWFDGKVRNSPCDGYERPIANSLVVVRKMGGRPMSTSSSIPPERRQDAVP